MGRARRALPFWGCLLLILWLLVAAAREPLAVGAEGMLTLLPALLMVVLAAALLVLRRAEPSACLLALYLIALALLTRDNTAGSPLIQNPHSYPFTGYHPHHLAWLLTLAIAPLACAWTLTAPDYAPQRRPFPMRMLLGLTLVGAGAQTAFLLICAPALSALTHSELTPYHRLLLAAVPLVMTPQSLAFWLLLRHYRQWGEARNRVVTLFFGVTQLFVASVIINDTLRTADTSLPSNLLSLLVPILLVYALERHALFDIQIAIRRVVQYAFARQVLSAMVVMPVVAFAFLIGLSLNPGAHQTFDNHLSPLYRTAIQQGPLLCVILATVFLLMLMLRIPLMRWFDRTYFREVYDAQNVLEEVGRTLLSLRDPRDIANTTLLGIDTVLHPVNAILLAEEEGGILCLARRSYAGYQPPLWPDPALLTPTGVVRVPRLDRPPGAQRADCPWLETLPAPARTLLQEAAIRLVVPLREGDQASAVLLLGEKASGLAYAPEDIEMLRALASQVALAMQSARLNREFLRRRTQELTTGSVGFVELVEQERHLLAADLHDQTLPELRCLLTDLQSLADAKPIPPDVPVQNETRIAAEKMADQLRQTIQDIRDIMESLRPSALEMLGLLPALESELRKAAARARPPLVPQFHAAQTTLPDRDAFAEMSVFRIVQEAVNNACRHAGARIVRVEIGRDEGAWWARVEDDGAGLPPENERSKGRGLDNMRYRAHLIGAQLTWSAPEGNNGTRVELRLPLRASS